MVERMLEGVLDWLLLSDVFGLLLLDWVLERVDWLLVESDGEDEVEVVLEGVVWLLDDVDDVVVVLVVECLVWLLVVFEVLDDTLVWVLERVDWLLEESVFEELIDVDGDVEGVLLFGVDEDNVGDEEALH